MAILYPKRVGSIYNVYTDGVTGRPLKAESADWVAPDTANCQSFPDFKSLQKAYPGWDIQAVGDAPPESTKVAKLNPETQKKYEQALKDNGMERNNVVIRYADEEDPRQTAMGTAAMLGGLMKGLTERQLDPPNCPVIDEVADALCRVVYDGDVRSQGKLEGFMVGGIIKGDVEKIVKKLLERVYKDTTV